MKDKEAKENKAKESNNWDQRILRSEKMRDLYADIITEKGEKKIPEPQVTKSKVVTEVIVD